MKLSLLTFSMAGDAIAGKADAYTLAAAAKENGIDKVDVIDFEIGIYGADKMREAFEKTGVSCGCIICNVPVLAASGEQDEKLDAAVALTVSMNADTLMIIPGCEEGDGNGAEKNITKTELMKRAADMYARAVKKAAGHNITIAFEDTPNYLLPLSSPKDCKELLDRVPGLGFVFDSANFMVAEPDCDITEAWELLKSRTVRVHLKDVVLGNFDTGERLADGRMMRAVVTGSGILPMEKIIKKIISDGFEGYAAVEYSASPEVHGANHSKYIYAYVRNIHNAITGKNEKAPQAEINGLGKKVSRLFFGTAIAPMIKGHDVFALLDAAMSCGINAFDCARGYGLAERSLGKWIKERNNREKVVILTKCGNCDVFGNVHITKKVIENELNKSLRELGCGYIDIYLLHRDDPDTPAAEFIETLNKAKRDGKIRIFGVSNWTCRRIEEANQYAAEHGLEGFAVSSPNFGLARQKQDPWGGGCVTISGPDNAGARAWYETNQMPVIAYSSLGRGFFSGKFRAFDYEAAEKILDGAAKKGYLCEENMHRLRNAEVLSKRDNCTVSQIAMRYVFGSAMNIFAIVSTTNPIRLSENLAAALTPLCHEDIIFLERDRV